MKYDIDRATVVLTVEELCTLALTRGDLDLRAGHHGPSFEAAIVSDRVRCRLQETAGASYTPQVPISHTVLYHDLAFEVSGMVDGICHTDPLTVDGIRVVAARSLELPPSPERDAPLLCYAYFLCRQKELPEIAVRHCRVGREGEKLRAVTERHSAEELEAFYFDLLARIEYRARILCEHETVLRPSVGSGRFPYASTREGQETLIKECYRDIRAGKRLFAEAPTGLGKTVSTLYPAVRALGEGYCDKIFYLTAKSATRREAYGAAAAIFEAGSHLRTVVLTARDQICKNEAARRDPTGITRHCNPLDCPYAKGFFDRLPTALCDLLSRQSGYSRRTVEETAQKHRICPYEFSLALSELCDIIICDYNYVFDPQAYLRRYFSPDAVDREKYVLLVDEAHNLADRARAMYSASLSTKELRPLSEQLPQEHPLSLPLEKLGATLQGFRRLCRDTIERDSDGVERGYYLNHGAIPSFCELVTQTRRTLENWLRTNEGDPLARAMDAYAATLKRFEVISEYFDESFLTFIELEGETRTVRLICLDPSRVLDARMNRAHAAVLFSATLTPTDYFADILGGGKGAVRIHLPSPFNPENLCLCAVTGVSTRYEDREKSYRKLTSIIAGAVSARAGNYIVYFPSYAYMEKVAEHFAARYPNVPLVKQSKNMSAGEKEAFLDAFADDDRLRIGFCVLGGSFSEGVDLPGKRLIGTVIVGTGLPGISNERNILRDHYEVTRERGYDYAYLYPGMNRVLQAAGRVIRREDDRGVVVLVDDRYADPRTRGIFPDHWEGIEYAGNAGELAEIVRSFWEKFR